MSGTNLRERCENMYKTLPGRMVTPLLVDDAVKKIEAFALEISNEAEQKLVDAAYRSAHDASIICAGNVPVGMFFTYEQLARLTEKQAGPHALAATVSEEKRC